MDISWSPGELVRQIHSWHVGAHDAVVRLRFGFRATAGRPVQHGVVGQLPVAGCRTVATRDLAVLNRQNLFGHSELFRRDRQIQVARFRADFAQRRPGMLDRQTASGHPLVGAEICCRRGHSDTANVDIEFLGGHLGQRGENALAQLDLAGPHLHGAVGVDAQPVSQPRVGRKGRREVFGAHPAASRISAAAASTARTTRLCAPHRQRL